MNKTGDGKLGFWGVVAIGVGKHVTDRLRNSEVYP